MRKLTSISLSICIGAVLAVTLMENASSVRAGTASGASQNGGVNGDGTLDISDFVYTLIHLFKSGPEPVLLDDPPELLARIATLEAQLADVRSARKKVITGQRFHDNGDGTTTDHTTGLTWASSSTIQLGASDRLDPALRNHFEFAGRADWRIPSPDEAATLGQWLPSGLQPGTTLALVPTWPAMTLFWTLRPDDFGEFMHVSPSGCSPGACLGFQVLSITFPSGPPFSALLLLVRE